MKYITRKLYSAEHKGLTFGEYRQYGVGVGLHFEMGRSRSACDVYCRNKADLPKVRDMLTSIIEKLPE